MGQLQRDPLWPLENGNATGAMTRHERCIEKLLIEYKLIWPEDARNVDYDYFNYIKFLSDDRQYTFAEI